MRVQNEADFRKIPRLRLRVDQDGTAIAWAGRRNRRYVGDHLYFHGRGKLGIYIEKRNPMLFSAAWKRYEAMTRGTVCPELCLRGEEDGILIFEPRNVGDIPRVFFKSSTVALVLSPESTRMGSVVS